MPRRRNTRNKRPTQASGAGAAAAPQSNTIEKKQLALYRANTLKLIQECKELSEQEAHSNTLALPILLRVPLTTLFILILRMDPAHRQNLNHHPIAYSRLLITDAIAFIVSAFYSVGVGNIHILKALTKLEAMPLATMENIDAARAKLTKITQQIAERYRRFTDFSIRLVIGSLLLTLIFGSRVLGQRTLWFLGPLILTLLGRHVMHYLDDQASRLIWQAAPQTGFTEAITTALQKPIRSESSDWQVLAKESAHPLWSLVLPRRQKTVTLSIDSQKYTLLPRDFLIAVSQFSQKELLLITTLYPNAITLQLTPAALNTDIATQSADTSTFTDAVKQRAEVYTRFTAKVTQLNELIRPLRLSERWQHFIPESSDYAAEDGVQFTLYIANEALRDGLLETLQAVYGETAVTTYGPQLRITGLEICNEADFKLPEIKRTTPAPPAAASADKAEADDSDDEDSSDDDLDDYFEAAPPKQHWSATAFSFLRSPLRSEPGTGAAAAAVSAAGDRIPKWNNPRYNDLTQGYPKRFKAIDRGNGAIHWVYFDEKRLTRKLGDANLLGEFSELFSTATFSTHNLGEVGHKMHWSINKAVLKKGGRGNNEIEGPQVTIDTEGHALYSLDRLGKHGK